ncbi:DNA/RNA polymerase [Thelephora ganbajun]|uniref:DNA/RNA polymerase n=1 Tax=Thelephora ganbajun TaxID=370292 RepID=A0ACB6ZHU7_THEGA|nr:DNA/RNA polymerase [Thelephora ganbajun]
MWKGKERATTPDSDSEFLDLNPIITYRHLQSHALGVKDPLRVIALCDSDAFYAGCEMVRLGVDPEQPLVVSQWDSIIAVNYPSRKFGITRMDKVKDAQKRCQNLMVVHVATYKEGDAEPGHWENPNTKTHKVSLDLYRRESSKVHNMFKESLPAGVELEKASIDECFIDFTRPVREELLRRYPHLAQAPPTGTDTPLPPPSTPIIWNANTNLVPINPKDDVTDNPGGPSASTRGDSELEEPPITWHDVALSIAADMMERARDQVRTKLGYSTSAGIGRNKFLAKLTASYRKPNSQSVLRNAAIPHYLRPLPFQKIRFLGGKLGNAVAKEYEVSTVGDLLAVSLDEFQKTFGEDSIWIWEIIRGIDRSEVKEKPPNTKSMAASKNLATPVTMPCEGPHWVRVMAAELTLRLNDARELSPNLWPRTISLSTRQGWSVTQRKQAPFPFVRNVTIDVVAAAGDKLWKELVGPLNSTKPLSTKITHVCLSLHGVEAGEVNQQGIESFLSKTPNSPSKRKRKVDSDNEVDETMPTSSHGESELKLDIDYFVCDRCKKQITLPKELMTASALDEDIRRDALGSLRAEHQDFHFAQDLSRMPSDDERPRRPNSESTIHPKKKRKHKGGGAEGEGIARFFTKR